MESRTLFLFVLLTVAGFAFCKPELLDPEADAANQSSSASNEGDAAGSAKYNLPVPIASSDVASSGKFIILPGSNKHDTALIAALDGMVYLVEKNTRKVRWSFSSGPVLSSSYHASLGYSSDDDEDEEYEDREKRDTAYMNGYFIEHGDDGNLYEHIRHTGRRKLLKTIEEYVNGPPHVLNGALTYGYKKLTIFLVDARTGRILDTFRPHDFQSMIGVSNDEKPLISKKEMDDLLASSPDFETIEPLMIIRTDYSLQSFVLTTKELLWNITVAKINATPLSQGFDNARDSLKFEGNIEPSSAIAHPSFSYLSGPETALSLPNYFSEPYCKDKLLPLPYPLIQSSHLAEKQISPYDVVNSCEVERTCLMELGDKDKRLVGGMLVEVTVLSLIVLIFLLYCLRKLKQDKKSSYLSGNYNIGTKKRKARQKGNFKNVGSVSRQENHIAPENEDREGIVMVDTKRTDNKSSINCKKVDDDCSGRWVGKLLVSNKEIAKGSNGTVVFEGTVYDDQHLEGAVYDLQHPVAVKRLVLAHNDVAFKEIKILRESKHSNIVHLYGVERDLDFVYIALERCTCSLNDLIQLFSDPLKSLSAGCSISDYGIECKVQLRSIMGIDSRTNLWEANGHPSSQLLKLMRDVVCGLAHLHDLGIIHRDLKPHNVLISSGKSLCAKLADMGISKRLHNGMSSLGNQVTGSGSSGWQAPEQLLHGRQTRAMDLFSLGCLLFFCITKGKHPFGDYLERDANIAKNRFDLFLVEDIPEAVHLFSHLLEHDPEKRPKADEVLHHPLFWSPEKRLLFLQDASDRIELAERVGDSDILDTLENVAPLAVNGNWGEKLEATFIKNIGNYRRYKYDNVRDLLRLIRNKSSHYIDLPQEVQELVGTYPDGCYDYFARRFPKLLIEVYKVVYRYCREEIIFRKYFKSDMIVH